MGVWSSGAVGVTFRLKGLEEEDGGSEAISSLLEPQNSYYSLLSGAAINLTMIISSLEMLVLALRIVLFIRNRPCVLMADRGVGT